MDAFIWEARYPVQYWNLGCTAATVIWAYHGRYLVLVFSVLHAVYPCHKGSHHFGVSLTFFHRFTHYFVATDVYALFLKSFKKIATYMFKTRGRGEGSKAFWTMLKKTALFIIVGFPLKKPLQFYILNYSLMVIKLVLPLPALWQYGRVKVLWKTKSFKRVSHNFNCLLICQHEPSQISSTHVCYL